MQQFSATIIKDSVNYTGTRITTFELEYPRFIHAELLTHRLFSRNSASSRAIPVSKIIEQVRNNPAMPIHWGKNQAGMQAKEQLTGVDLESAKIRWLESARNAADSAEEMSARGGHKQWVNRILEPYQIMKVVLTSTDFDNYFWLRDHADAQPEILHLAKLMKAEYESSIPEHLIIGQWHLPYVRTLVLSDPPSLSMQRYYDETGTQITLEQAIKISCSSCAQVSYRKLDTSLEKAEDLYKRLVESEPVHASAFEHVAKCEQGYIDGVPESEGWTYEDFDRNLYSGNFKNWVQYRQLIPNNSKAYQNRGK